MTARKAQGPVRADDLERERRVSGPVAINLDRGHAVALVARQDEELVRCRPRDRCIRIDEAHRRGLDRGEGIQRDDPAKKLLGQVKGVSAQDRGKVRAVRRIVQIGVGTRQGCGIAGRCGNDPCRSRMSYPPRCDHLPRAPRGGSGAALQADRMVQTRSPCHVGKPLRFLYAPAQRPLAIDVLPRIECRPDHGFMLRHLDAHGNQIDRIAAAQGLGICKPVRRPESFGCCLGARFIARRHGGQVQACKLPYRRMCESFAQLLSAFAPTTPMLMQSK